MDVRRVVPILNVSDVAASLEWFHRLGWSTSLEWHGPPGAEGTVPGFGGVASGDCEIFLCRDGQGGRGRGSATVTGGPEADQTSDKGVWMTVWVGDVDAVHRQCVELGMDVTCPPREEPWGVREMHLRHPDGHVFRFTQALLHNHSHDHHDHDHHDHDH